MKLTRKHESRYQTVAPRFGLILGVRSSGGGAMELRVAAPPAILGFAKPQPASFVINQSSSVNNARVETERRERVISEPKRRRTHLYVIETIKPQLRLFIIILMALLLIQIPSQANQADLNTLIAGLQTKYSRMNGLAADFVQVYHTSDGRTKRESGSLLLRRPGKARWTYSSPERKVFVSDGKNIFFHVFGEKYATRSTVKQSVDPQIPFLFLLGRGNIHRDFSTIEVMADERPVESGNVVLRLVPKRAPEDFKQILAEVSPQRFSMNRLVIIERSGARMDFYLNNVRENHIAADSEFTFTPPTGVSIRQAQ